MNKVFCLEFDWICSGQVDWTAVFEGRSSLSAMSAVKEQGYVTLFMLLPIVSHVLMMRTWPLLSAHCHRHTMQKEAYAYTNMSATSKEFATS